jgi:hypothetical protein
MSATSQPSHTREVNGLKASLLLSFVLTLQACGGREFGSPLGTMPATTRAHTPALPEPDVRPNLSGAAAPFRSRPMRAPGTGWLSPAAKSGALLYVSDWNANVVDVYSYPSLKPAGQLTDDMLNPDGLCTDAKGDVFVVNNTPNAYDVLEFAHGGTTPIQTLGNPGQVGVGCSVDPVTGNLAVTNVEALYSGRGSVSIYIKATGTPTMYSDPDMASVYFCGYDDKGNLYLDGFSGGPSEGSFQFAELPKGKSTFKAIALKAATIHFPGGILWDGKYVDVADQIYSQNGSVLTSAVYRTTGAGAKVVSKEILAGSDDVSSYAIDGSTLIGTNYDDATAGFWKYPKGGKPTDELDGFEYPIGVAISK